MWERQTVKDWFMFTRMPLCRGIIPTLICLFNRTMLFKTTKCLGEHPPLYFSTWHVLHWGCWGCFSLYPGYQGPGRPHIGRVKYIERHTTRGMWQEPTARIWIMYRFGVQTCNPLAVGRWCLWSTTTIPFLQGLPPKLISISYQLLLQFYDMIWCDMILYSLINKYHRYQ